MQHVEHLAGTIGYRIVGTSELAESVDYLATVIQELKAQALAAGSTKEIEVWTQTANGSHLFDFMDKVHALLLGSTAGCRGPERRASAAASVEEVLPAVQRGRPHLVT